MSVGDQFKCAACGEWTPAGKFCIHCGASARPACPSCGEPVVPSARFCLECGTPLSDTVAARRASGASEPV